MAVDLMTALAKVELAARDIFGSDEAVRSVGVGEVTGGYGFVAVRNVHAPAAFSARARGNALTEFDGIPVTYACSNMDPTQLARVPYAGPGSPAVGSVIQERQAHSDMRCGLQIQNFDQDARSRVIDSNIIWVGTLGCFVKLAGSETAILSNNHVLAGENLGRLGDRISQPGDLAFASHVATLTNFVPLKFSPAGASVATGTALLNEVDAGVAALEAGVSHSQAFLASRLAVAPRGTASALPRDKVHKVGRTTGLTFGTVKQIGVVIECTYESGLCWFRQCIAIVGKDGTTFADQGDSGSAIVRDDGMIVGLLFSGSDTTTYACPIDKVLHGLNCQLA